METQSQPSNSETIKEFSVEGLNLVLTKPSVSILREAKFRYNKVFTAAIRDGFFTKKRLEESLKHGDVNIMELHIGRRAEILNLYGETNIKLNESKDPELIEYYANLLSFYRDALVKEDMEMTNLFSTTAEQFAEDERLNYLTFMLIKTKEGKPFWEKEEDYYNDTRLTIVENCKYNIICWEYKLDPDWQQSLPEVQAMIRAKDIRALLEKEAEAKTKEQQAVTKSDKVKKNKTKPATKKAKATKGKEPTTDELAPKA